MSDYDVVVVGSGLAGLTAALFAARHGLSTLVLEANVPGGHLINIEKIEDFPGFPDGIPGYELCPNLQQQAANEGAEFQRVAVQSLQAEGRLWRVTAAEDQHRTKAVIIATGSTLKELGVPGETKLMGRGVSHCASCDGPLYHGQVVGVVGGGDSALQEALTLTNHAERVLIFQEAATFSAQHTYRARVLGNPKIEAHYQMAVEEILGENTVTGVRLRNLLTGDRFQTNISGLFVYVGLKPNTGFLSGILRLSDTGHVPTDVWMKTERDGLYAVGDIRQDSPAQAITSAGEGAAAAVAAYRYVKEKFGDESGLN
jgi:thioredoxin reductase (NADPH)